LDKRDFFSACCQRSWLTQVAGVGTLPIAIGIVSLVVFYLVSKTSLFVGMPAIC